MREFMSLESACATYETPRKALQNLSYFDRRTGRDDRFCRQDGHLYVRQNYKCPHFDDIAELYYRALECADSEKEIAKFISRRTGKNINAVYFYFRNFKFKNPDFARIVAKLLEIFIRQNNLFAEVGY